jgi:hypothetical protein
VSICNYLSVHSIIIVILNANGDRILSTKILNLRRDGRWGDGSVPTAGYRQRLRSLTGGRGDGRVVSYKKIKMQKPWCLVFNRPELKFGLIAKVH